MSGFEMCFAAIDPSTDGDGWAMKTRLEFSKKISLTPILLMNFLILFSSRVYVRFIYGVCMVYIHALFSRVDSLSSRCDDLRGEVSARGTTSMYLTHTAHRQARHTPKSLADCPVSPPLRRKGY